MFLNGAGIIKFQVITSAIFGVGCLIVKVAFTHLYGVAGVPWSTIIAYATLTVIPSVVYVPRVLQRMADAAELNG